MARCKVLLVLTALLALLATPGISSAQSDEDNLRESLHYGSWYGPWDDARMNLNSDDVQVGICYTDPVVGTRFKVVRTFEELDARISEGAVLAETSLDCMR
jgi:hypothetical protein